MARIERLAGALAIGAIALGWAGVLHAAVISPAGTKPGFTHHNDDTTLIPGNPDIAFWSLTDPTQAGDDLDQTDEDGAIVTLEEDVNIKIDRLLKVPPVTERFSSGDSVVDVYAAFANPGAGAISVALHTGHFFDALADMNLETLKDVDGLASQDPAHDNRISPDSVFAFGAIFQALLSSTKDLYAIVVSGDTVESFAGIDYDLDIRFMQIPLPAAAWLVISALIGLAGFGTLRRVRE